MFDALSMPAQKEQMKGTEIAELPETTYCLMQSDSLLTGYNIQTERLLTKPDADKHEVRLVIKVDIRVLRAKPYNYLFFGE